MVQKYHLTHSKFLEMFLKVHRELYLSPVGLPVSEVRGQTVRHSLNPDILRGLGSSRIPVWLRGSRVHKYSL